jgi:Glycosyl hydrolase family 20, catalytic domain
MMVANSVKPGLFIGTSLLVVASLAGSAQAGGVPATYPAGFVERFAATVTDFESRGLDQLDGRTLRVLLGNDSDGTDCGALAGSGGNAQAYSIEVGPDAVTICGKSARAAVFGLSRLQRRLDGGPLERDTVVEEPALDVRAVHVVLRRLSQSDVERIIREARLARFNTLILMLADGVKLDSYPGGTPASALTAEQLRAIGIFARENGLDVIPEIKLLSHQQLFFKDSAPELMFNKVTYDPAKEQVYRVVEAYLDEVIDVLQPVAIHIGHDEIRGFGASARKRWLDPGEKPLGADAFLGDVIRLHRIIGERGLETWMWGDMLLDKDLLPEILQRSWSERSDYADVISSLPKDIVINDWHYFDKGPEFPTIDYFSRRGFTVFGSTWYDLDSARSFASYVAKHEAGRSGMVATLWRMPQNDKWSEITEVIDASGTFFWDGE